MKKLVCLCIGMLLFSGCKSLTPVTPSASIDTSLKARVILENVDSSSLSFETLQWRGHASLNDDGKRQKVSVTTRLKKGEGIWVNGTVIVPLARLFITPDSLQFYEKIHRQYIQEDYKRLKQLLGVSIDFSMLENILTAKPVDQRALKRAKLSFTESAYVFTIARKKSTLTFVFDTSFRLVEQRLMDGENKMSVVYKEYTLHDKQWFPEQITATLFGEKKATSVTLSAQQVELNRPLKMPFNLPEGYTPIRLE